MVPAATGRGVLQRTQFRSPGGLATPHAGLLHMLGGVSGSAVLLSPWSKKPQSMQAMAPSRSLAPHCGQAVAPADGCGTGPPRVTEPMVLAGGLAPLPAGTVGGAAPAGLPPAVLAPAPTGCRAAGTVNGLLQAGQRTFRPAALSGSCIGFWQCGQRITCGMVVLVVAVALRRRSS